MPRDTSSKKLGRKGVDAIFTPTKYKRDARLLFGLAGVLVGVFLWITVAVSSTHPKFLGVSRLGSYQTLLLSSLGLVLAIEGFGICLTYARHLSINLDSELEKRMSTDRPRGIVASRNLKLGLVAFLQSCFVVALYSGLSDEYQSNVSMQHWVASVIPDAEFLLSWEAVIIVAAILGLTAVQFLPGRTLAEIEFRPSS